MAALSKDHVQSLLDQPRGRGMVVSCYADTSVAEGFEAHWLQPFKSEVSRVRQSLADDHQARQEFERNVEVIRRALEAPEVAQAKGMAVFSAAGRDFVLALSSDVPFENRLVLDEVPYVVPLIESYLRERGYLAVVTDTHRGLIYAAGNAGARLLDQFDEEVPKKNRSAGERWGKQQATIARHREDHILHYHKELAERVEHRWDEYPYEGIVLLGAADVVSAFQGLLPERLRSRVVDLAPHAWTEGRATIEEEVRTVSALARAARERQILGELAGRLEEACAVAAGPQEVIDALRNGQVSDLILGPDPGATASRCPGCRSLLVAAPRACPYCHTPCDACNLWQEVLALALAHGLRVHLVRPDPQLQRHGGIAALLQRDNPQWASASVEQAPK